MNDLNTVAGRAEENGWTNIRVRRAVQEKLRTIARLTHRSMAGHVMLLIEECYAALSASTGEKDKRP